MTYKLVCTTAQEADVPDLLFGFFDNFDVYYGHRIYIGSSCFAMFLDEPVKHKLFLNEKL